MKMGSGKKNYKALRYNNRQWRKETKNKQEEVKKEKSEEDKRKFLQMVEELKKNENNA
ncbi:MAG: hypothetical protein QT11_C0001G0310 [archaeon GW2011_AR20]|nr:MAG: hypothetical protein QT11_C0001G0310 [archaeon GW2011_AR20]AQS28478.1 hypothetical protein [uncultured archaeon]